MSLQCGDRVDCRMADREGNPLYGTIVDANFLGLGVLVKCDTLVDKRYCYTDDKEVLFRPSQLNVIKD